MLYLNKVVLVLLSYIDKPWSRSDLRIFSRIVDKPTLKCLSLKFKFGNIF